MYSSQAAVQHAAQRQPQYNTHVDLLKFLRNLSGLRLFSYHGLSYVTFSSLKVCNTTMGQINGVPLQCNVKTLLASSMFPARHTANTPTETLDLCWSAQLRNSPQLDYIVQTVQQHVPCKTFGSGHEWSQNVHASTPSRLKVQLKKQHMMRPPFAQSCMSKLVTDTIQ